MQLSSCSTSVHGFPWYLVPWDCLQSMHKLCSQDMIPLASVEAWRVGLASVGCDACHKVPRNSVDGEWMVKFVLCLDCKQKLNSVQESKSLESKVILFGDLMDSHSLFLTGNTDA